METLRLPDEGHWIIAASADSSINRQNEPNILDLGAAVEWIKQEKPLMWLGSLFSVPSRFPSGKALTKSLLEMVFADALHQDQKDEVIDTLLSRWPLEAILDEFERLGFDLSTSLLDYFKELNGTASPNPLHYAVTNYYQAGFARKPLCFTTNWDTLQESAFRQAGYRVVTNGPGDYPKEKLDEAEYDPNLIFVFHAHGSFDTKDVVCSFRQQQRQLPILPQTLEMLNEPILYLGYSGYEPSMYHALERGTKQFWCIPDRLELEIPAKRRLLYRPNTFVFVGDIRELLRELGCLQEDVNLQSLYLTNDNVLPPALIETVRTSLFASLSPTTCAELLGYNLLSFLDEPIATLRYGVLMRAVVNHVRNRALHPALLLSLMSAARFRDTEQTWITILAYQLRFLSDLDSSVIQHLLQESEKAKSSGAEYNAMHDEIVHGPFLANFRSQIYRSYVRHEERLDTKSLQEKIIRLGFFCGDLAAYGEFLEILAFEYLREGEKELARNVFDSASTNFYLCGLWNSGQLNEWAARNIERVRDAAKGNSLVIPIE